MAAIAATSATNPLRLAGGDLLPAARSEQARRVAAARSEQARRVAAARSGPVARLASRRSVVLISGYRQNQYTS